MTERERILANFSAAEIEIYRRLGGRVPRYVEALAARCERAPSREVVNAVRAERVTEVFELARRKREQHLVAAEPVMVVSKRRFSCRGSAVVSASGNYWRDATVAAWALGLKRQTIVNGCGGRHLVRGMELFWLKRAPKRVKRFVAAKRRERKAA